MGRWFEQGQGDPLAAKEIAVTAVQLPLTSFEADVAAVHGRFSLPTATSFWSATAMPARLVYIDAVAPDADESAGSLFAQFESAPLGGEIRPDAEGFLKPTRDGIFNLFAQDLGDDEKAHLLATRGRSMRRRRAARSLRRRGRPSLRST